MTDKTPPSPVPYVQVVAQMNPTIDLGFVDVPKAVFELATEVLFFSHKAVHDPSGSTCPCCESKGHLMYSDGDSEPFNLSLLGISTIDHCKNVAEEQGVNCEEMKDAYNAPVFHLFRMCKAIYYLADAHCHLISQDEEEIVTACALHTDSSPSIAELSDIDLRRHWRKYKKDGGTEILGFELTEDPPFYDQAVHLFQFLRPFVDGLETSPHRVPIA